MKQKYLIVFLYLAISLLLSCKHIDHEYIEIHERNMWIKETMETFYLWIDQIPENLDPYSSIDSKAYFEKYRYEDDPWSWISDDYFKTINKYNGISSTSGMQYSLGIVADKYSIVGVVGYVLPGTPAAEANIKRGDIFSHVNGISLNMDNYYGLLTAGGTYTLSFVKMKDQILELDRVVSITEIENYEENPIFIDTVFEVENRKIGYLMYNSFLIDFEDEVADVFNEFKLDGITDLILDLRYNSGGSADAEKHLADLIAPESALGEIYSNTIYNDIQNERMRNRLGPNYCYSRIRANDANINLTGNLIGITSPQTASASEELLNGLDPFVNLTIVGDTTHGKYTSMIVLPDNKKNPKWAIIPIVAMMTNKNNVSVKGGIAPDISLDDNPLDGYPLGDIREAMLSKAIEQITGIPTLKSARIKHDFIQKPFTVFKGSEEVRALPIILNIGEIMPQ